MWLTNERRTSRLSLQEPKHNTRSRPLQDPSMSFCLPNMSADQLPWLADRAATEGKGVGWGSPPEACVTKSCPLPASHGPSLALRRSRWCHSPPRKFAGNMFSTSQTVALAALVALLCATGGRAAIDADEITSLPGWTGALPSRQWSGYIKVPGDRGSKYYHCGFPSRWRPSQRLSRLPRLPGPVERTAHPTFTTPLDMAVTAIQTGLSNPRAAPRLTPSLSGW